MARNQEVLDVSGSDWVEITNADVLSITFVVLSGAAEIRIGTTTAPTSSDGGLPFFEGEGILQTLLSELAFGGGNRVWARRLRMFPSKSRTTRFPEITKIIVDHG